jgi:hypothetical protein
MAELGKDVERYHRIGLVHPMERSVSGGVLEVKKGKEDGKTEDE